MVQLNHQNGLDTESNVFNRQDTSGGVNLTNLDSGIQSRQFENNNLNDESGIMLKKPYEMIIDFRISKHLLSNHQHICNAMIIAEDNTNILKR